MDMFDLEGAILEWKKAMRQSPSFEDGDLVELERYLRDKVEDLTHQGLSPEEAFRTAEAEFRRADALDDAYGHARAAHPARRFPWRPPRFSPGFLRSYIKIALRRLRLQKTYSLINIGGLALGLTACLLAFLWVQDEFGYDRFQKRADSIAQVYSIIEGGAGDWPGKDPALKVTLNWDYVNYDYFETLKTTFVAGRPFSPDFPSDIQGSYIINESAAKLMGFSDPVGQKIKIFTNKQKIGGHYEN
jgi:hypothetical protein